ncbi:MAG TPA: MEDS domain-containing protein [Nitrososphaeraceae archaeon]|nr:MEDS domain-containing protein [Nitrososphaeraceae archaeon]
MGRKDWYYVHLPKLLIKRLDQFLQTPRAKSMGMSSKPELLRHLINQFLEEQEAMYNKMDYVGDLILEMKDRDHAVFTYNNESQLNEIVNASVRRGVDRNQINVLLIYTKEQQKFIESINKVENVNYLFNSQDIIIIPADEGFSDDGSFSIMPSLNSIRNIVELAKKKSKNGLNVLATLPTKLIEQGRYEDALQLENMSNEAIKGLEMPITVLCLYKAVPENLEDRFSEYHDLIIKRVDSSESLQ